MNNQIIAELPSLRVDVVEHGKTAKRDWLRCEIGSNVQFDTARMETYFFAQWEPILYDALLLAAAVEFCDRTRRRPVHSWGRSISLRIPVHEPERWNSPDVASGIHDTLEFLTGDRWEVTFYARKKAESQPRQGQFCLRSDVAAVIPFSDGLDSRAVAGLMALDLGERLVRVRLGTKDFLEGKASRLRQPFTSVPYKVQAGEQSFVESSARSRGFKFALLSGLAAYLARTNTVIVPESGQGALGPTLVPVGQAYPDYRSHPMFTRRMENLLRKLLGWNVQYEFPQLWFTKGETLAQFVNKCEEGPSSWASTWSCWQQNRHASVEGKKRQCGICAACMLRRLSVHAAELSEPSTSYVWENLAAAAFKDGAAAAFDTKITRAMREYAIAGAMHLDHLAAIRKSPANAPAIVLSAFQLSQACSIPIEEARSRLDRMLGRHELEWNDFVGSLGAESFVTGWTARAQ